jgi:hypothetical protein
VNAKRHILSALSVMLALAGVFLLIAAACSFMSDRMTEVFEAGPQLLVYHTNHAAVLAACQQVLANPQAAGFPIPTNGTSMLDGSQNGGATPPAALSATLSNLNFEFMVVADHQATIYFGGGFGGWGYATTQPEPNQSQMQLIPGLWFWMDEGGQLPRDPSKFPYYRTSKRLLMGGVGTLFAAIVLVINSRRQSQPNRHHNAAA